MRTKGIIVFPPHFNEHLDFSEGSQIRGIEAFNAQFAIKGFTFSVLPWTARFNKYGGYAFVFQPLLQQTKYPETQFLNGTERGTQSLAR